MSEQKYYVLTVKSGYSIPHYGFESGEDGNRLFTEEHTKKLLGLSILKDVIPVALPCENLERLMQNIQNKELPELPEQRYYILTGKSGLNLLEHNFETAPNGSYLFTEEETREISKSEVIKPAAIPYPSLEILMQNIQEVNPNQNCQ